VAKWKSPNLPVPTLIKSSIVYFNISCYTGEREQKVEYMTKDAGKDVVAKLVENFDRNKEIYLAKSFQETETRTHFINPFFEALGWEFNRNDLRRGLWDVRMEVQAKVRESTRKPDYGFYVDGKLKFYVEAKAPWVKLSDPAPIFQAKSYAFSSNGVAPIVLLTDFQELRVFNALARPDYDLPLSGLVKDYDLRYEVYLDRWDDLYEAFSKEAVRGGSLVSIAGKSARNAKKLDVDFLDSIREWRELLAKNVAIRNEALNVDEVNEAVQRVIDRFVFIRNLEDRDIEPEDALWRLVSTKDEAPIMEHLKPLFRRLDEEYNGLLFKPHFSESLAIDDKVLKDIVSHLSQRSPYKFDVIEPEILGRIYEQFLGSKIRLTDSHRAKVEDKPEVRHAGGVYYTPQYIVDYIVSNTLGKVLKGKTPEEAASLRVLDPACGSGSFLLGAFSVLVEWHRHYYEAHKSERKYRSDWYETSEGELRLSLRKKAELLKRCLFGVDLDPQAVEVSIMSLYLKMLEEGFDHGQDEMFKKAILPELSANIRRGNSLVDRDQLYGQNMFGDEDIIAFDWNDFGTEGFDVIVGNPPYIKTQELQAYQPKTAELYKKLYKTATSGNYDIYVLFIERAISLLNDHGLLGYICPHKFFSSNYGVKTRELLSEKSLVSRIIFFGTNQVFENATTYTCLLFLDSKAHEYFQYHACTKDEELESSLMSELSFQEIALNTLSNNSWVFPNYGSKALVAINGTKSLEEVTSNIFQGPKAGADPVFILSAISKTDSVTICQSKSLNRQVSIETAILKSYVKGKYIRRFRIERGDEVTIFPYIDGQLIPEKKLQELYPLAHAYLSEKTNKDILIAREEGRFRKIWWSYSRPQNMRILFTKKILTPFNAFNASYSYDPNGDFVFSAGVSGAYGIVIDAKYSFTYEYLLGLLNSTILDKQLKTISTALRGDYFSYENKYIKQLPIYIPDPSDVDKYSICTRIEETVKKVIDLRRLADERSIKDAEFLEGKIDEMVSRLYY
jgi:type I restriction-modification system DNA methylase subunit